MKTFQIFLVIAFVGLAIVVFMDHRDNTKRDREIEAIHDIKKNVDIVSIIDSIERIRDRQHIDSLRHLKAQFDSMGRVMNTINTKFRKSNAALEKEVRRLDALLSDRPDF